MDYEMIIKMQQMNYENLFNRTNKMAGIIGSYKALLQCAIEVIKGDRILGVDYIEGREAEMICTINN